MTTILTNGVTGRSDLGSNTSIMKHTRHPVFVDNSIIHAVYKTGIDTGINIKSTTVNDVLTNDFQITSGKKYNISEEESEIRLTHDTRYQNEIFFDGNKLSTSDTKPSILVGANNSSQRLIVENIETTQTGDKGTRFSLQNMKGQTLQEIGMMDSQVRLAHTAAVGYRSSDLALQLFNQGTGQLNSRTLDINKNGKPRHSTTFVAQNFNGIDVNSAVRLVGKYDGFGMYYDKFGNLKYKQPTTHRGNKIIGTHNRLGKGKRFRVIDDINRVTVYGIPRALNDDNVVTMDAPALQGGTHNIPVKEIPGGVQDPTAITQSAARRVARKILRNATSNEGGLESEGHRNSYTISAGDTVKFIGEDMSPNVRILSATHRLHEKLSDFTMVSTESGIESMLQNLQDNIIVENMSKIKDSIEQIEKKELCFIAKVQIKDLATIKCDYYLDSGSLTIGDTSLGKIGKQTVGDNKLRVV